MASLILRQPPTNVSLIDLNSIDREPNRPDLTSAKASIPAEVVGSSTSISTRPSDSVGANFRMGFFRECWLIENYSGRFRPT